MFVVVVLVRLRARGNSLRPHPLSPSLSPGIGQLFV